MIQVSSGTIDSHHTVVEYIPYALPYTPDNRQLVHLNPFTFIHPAASTCPLWLFSLFSVSVSLFLFHLFTYFVT